MGGEFIHLPVGGNLKPAEYESIYAHKFKDQVARDILYAPTATSAPTRLGAGTRGLGGGITVAASDAMAGTKALADYVCDGTADDVEIQAAIEAANGGAVVLSEGQFNISSAVYLDIARTELQGMGWSTILKRPGGQVINWGIITITKDNCIVRDLAIDGNELVDRGTTVGYGLVLRGASDCLIDRVYSHDTDLSCFVIAWDYTNHAFRNTIQNCLAENSYADHLYYIPGTSQTQILNCRGKGFYYAEALKIKEDYSGGTREESNGNLIDGFELTAVVENPQGAGLQTPVVSIDRSYDVGAPVAISKNNRVVNSLFDPSALGTTLAYEFRINMFNTTVQNNKFNQVCFTFYTATANYSTILNNTIEFINSGGGTRQVIQVNGVIGNIIGNNIIATNSGAGTTRIFVWMVATTDFRLTDNTIKATVPAGTLFGHVDGSGSATLTNCIFKNNRLTASRHFYSGPPYNSVAFDATPESSKLDLSGAATDIEVYHALHPSYLTGYTITYTEVSSADAGVSIRIGRYQDGVALDDDYFDITTSEVSENKGYSLYVRTSALTQKDIAAGDTITVGTAGGKTGTGEVMVILQIAEMVD